MKVVNTNLANETLNVRGTNYEVDANGAVEVPDNIARFLLNTPHWNLPRKKSVKGSPLPQAPVLPPKPQSPLPDPGPAAVAAAEARRDEDDPPSTKKVGGSEDLEGGAGANGPDADRPEGPDLAKMSKAQLLETARGYEVEGVTDKMKRDEIIEVLDGALYGD